MSKLTTNQLDKIVKTLLYVFMQDTALFNKLLAFITDETESEFTDIIDMIDKEVK